IKQQSIAKQSIDGIKVADGSIMTNYGFHRLRVTLPGGRLFDIEALITTGDQCLLGMPFLEAGEALIDVATGWVRINNEWYCTQQRRTRYVGSAVVTHDSSIFDELLKESVLSDQERQAFVEIMMAYP